MVRDETFKVRMSGDELEQLAAATRRYDVSASELVRRGLARVTAEPPVYRFGADDPDAACLVKDLAAGFGGLDIGIDRDEARDRLRRFKAWSEDTATNFATITTGTASQVIPPGYRVVTDLVFAGDRPLVDAADRTPIASTAPIQVPRINEGSFDAIDEARTEGNQAADGTLTPSQRTVVPVVRTGRLVLTRELVDTASPAGDVIALTTAREDYLRSVEALCYAELNGANGQGGTITSGFVPSGAQARVSTGAALPTDLKLALAEYATRRLAKARNVIVGGTTAPTQLVPALDDATGDDTAVARIQGARINWATTTFGGAAGDGDVLILSSGDFYVWESPLLSFSYEEKSGPATLELGVWAYAAAGLVRPRGLSSLRHT